MAENRCLFPGSFDPVTMGHLDIIRRAASVFDEVVVGVLHNPEKPGRFPVERRIAMLEKACAGIPGVKITAFGGLTVDLARQMDVRVLVRGVRGPADLESETAMAAVNRVLLPGLETVFLPAATGKNAISSTMVCQLAAFGAPLDGFVPDVLIDEIRAAYARKEKGGDHCAQ